MTALALANDWSVARWGLARAARDAFPCAMEPDSKQGGLTRVLVEQRARLLRFLAARGAGDDAEDVLHDLWQRLESTPQQPIADPVAYLFRAAENVMRDRRRSTISRERRQQDWHDASVGEHEEALGERVLIARQRLREAEDVLAAQGPRVSEVFRRYRLDGVGQATIARDMGVSLSSIEKDLQKAYRALAQLKKKIDAE
jgi:RNA polymerase sigma factor (sigma-70 family)